MVTTVFGAILVVHGLVHLLYFGQSAGYFELKPGMVWPNGSWAFSRFLGIGVTRNLASATLVLAAAAFVVAGSGLFARQAWWGPLAVSAALLSTAIYFLLWDGRMEGLDNKGGVGVLINLAILAAVLSPH